MKLVRFIVAGIVLTSFLSTPLKGQFLDETLTVKYDTNYIRVYKDVLATRLYVARKQNSYNLNNGLYQPWMKYKTNDNILIGLGYTYNFLTINLGFKLPFINQDDDLYGKSKYFDLKTNFMFRDFIVDFYLQWNRGYYLSNPEDVYNYWDLSQEAMPQRGDMRTNIVGFNVQYLFNHERYSSKASLWHNEIQRKSAGSPIVGVEAYWTLAMTDSLMVEDAIPLSGFMDDQPFNQNDMYNVGINGGYAYTFVWAERLSLSLSTVFGISACHNRVHYTPDSYTLSRGFSFGLTNTTRISMGFNSPKYYAGLSFERFSMNTMAGSPSWFSYKTGQIRINIVKRIHLKRPIKILRPDLWIF